MSYCDCDYDYDPPEFGSINNVKRARKVHRCDECSGPIFAGESYQRLVGVWDGRFDEYKECAACLNMRAWAVISMPCFCSTSIGELHERILDMVRDVAPKVPGFYFEYGRQMVKLKRRRSKA